MTSVSCIPLSSHKPSSQPRSICTSNFDAIAKDAFGATPLHCAIAEKNEQIATFLIENGADVLAQDRDGSTPLHYAVEYRLPRVAEELLKKNPEVGPSATNLEMSRYGLRHLMQRETMNWCPCFYVTERILPHRNHVNLSPLDIALRTLGPCAPDPG